MFRYSLTAAILMLMTFMAMPSGSAQAFQDTEGVIDCTVTYSKSMACYDGIGGDGNMVHNCASMNASDARAAAGALNCQFVDRSHNT